MTKIETLEQKIRELTPEELARFREWFAQFDADAWDREIEADAKSGKVDQLASRALRAHARHPS